MNEHTPLREAAILAEGRKAGAIIEKDLLDFISPSELVSAADAVAELKIAKPHFFVPKHARDMSESEYAEACKKVGVRPGGARRTGMQLGNSK